MRGALFMVIILIGMLLASDIYLDREIIKIKQEITQLRKDFSYDPKDAK